MDGDTLPGQPVDAWSMDVPLMIGATHDEATAMCLADPQWRTLSAENLLGRAVAMAGAEAAPVLLQEQEQLCPDDEPMHLWSGLLTRLNFHEPTLQIAHQWAAAGRAPVHVYRVDRTSPLAGGILRSPHVMELPFLFRNAEGSRDLVGSGDDLHSMMDTTSSAFASFARGTPKLGDEPWLPFTLERRNVAVLNTVSQQVSIGRSFLADDKQPG